MHEYTILFSHVTMYRSDMGKSNMADAKITILSLISNGNNYFL